MARLHVSDLRIGEELLNGRNRFIANISTPCASDEQCWALVADLARFLVREVCHILEGGSDHGKWHAELHRLVFFRADKIGQEKLANGQRLEDHLVNTMHPFLVNIAKLTSS